MERTTTAERLNQILTERNLKQKDVLDKCEPYCIEHNVKLNKNDLSQYLSGKVTPKQDKLTILALALNVNEVWLMGYDVPSEPNALKAFKTNINKDWFDLRIKNLKLTRDELEQLYEYAQFLVSKRK